MTRLHTKARKREKERGVELPGRGFFTHQKLGQVQPVDNVARSTRFFFTECKSESDALNRIKIELKGAPTVRQTTHQSGKSERIEVRRSLLLHHTRSLFVKPDPKRT